MRALLPTLRRVAQVAMTSKQQPFCSATLVPQVVHNPADQKFVLPIEGYEAELLYRLKGSTIHLDHTEVPKELEGRGLGKILAKVCHYIYPNVHLYSKVDPFVIPLLNQFSLYPFLSGRLHLRSLQ